jgi:hypothetical protein
LSFSFFLLLILSGNQAHILVRNTTPNESRSNWDLPSGILPYLLDMPFGHNRAYMESLSTKTMMIDLLLDLGHPKMKSIDIFSHTIGGVWICCSSLGVFLVSTLLCWKRSHSTTKVRISLFMPSQKNENFIHSYVL